MHRALLTGFACGLLAICSLAQEKPLPPLKPAPPFHVERWIRAPEKPPSGWQDLRGKVVVLEFWATWCGPCVAAIPRLNDLERRFYDRGVRFVSISDEAAGTVEEFLAKRPIDGWVALDKDHSTFRAYGVQALPSTAVVDTNGNLLALSDVNDVTAGVLEQILSGNVEWARRRLLMHVPRVTMHRTVRGTGDARPATLEVSIRPSPTSSADRRSGISRSRNRIEANGMDLKSALSNAYGVPATRIVMPDSLAGERYDILVSVPMAQAEQFDAVFQRALETALGIQTRREIRETDVYVLRAPQGKGAAFREPAGTGGMARSGSGFIRGTGMPLGTLTLMLEGILGRPVLDETGIAGRYDYELHWDPAKPEILRSVVRDQLGLELREDKRPVELLIVKEKSGTTTARP